MSRIHPALKLIVVAVTYSALAVFSLTFSYGSSNATPVWPASGFAFSMLLLWGRGMWAGIFAGAFLGNLIIFIQNNITPGTAVPVSLFIAAGNTGEALAGYFLLRVLNKKGYVRNMFAQVQRVFYFVLTTLLMCVVSCTVGTLTVWASDLISSSDIGIVWLTWWSGDVSGILLLTPFLLVWLGRKPELRTEPAVIVETLALTVGIIFLSGIVFLDWFKPTFIFTRAFIIIPFIIWVSVRLRHRMLTLINIVSAIFVIAGTVSGIGPFIAPGLNESLITAETFVAVNCITVLVLKAAILEREEKEKSLILVRDHLEQEVLARTRELETKNRELEMRNQELNSFSYAASHDLQEPLRKIQTFSNQILQQENELSERGRSMFERVLNASARMKQLIENLLTFSRVANSRHLLEKTNLNQVLQDVLQELSEKIQQSEATVKSDPLPENIMVVPFQFHQLFTNLISNSIKFTKPGTHPQIHISYKLVSDADDISRDLGSSPYHHITVADNGIGFEMEYAEKIFEIFQRLHGKAEYEGTGIGLSICKKIVENHQGLIRAESRPGEGARFQIYLPEGK